MWTRIGYFARETLVSLRRNVLMTIAGIITVAVSLCVFGGILLLLELGRPRHRAVEGRRRARDLHEGRRRPTAQIDGGRRRSSTDDPDVNRASRTSTRTTRTTSSSGSSADQPDLVQTITPPDLPESFRVVPEQGRAHRDGRATSIKTVPGVDEVKTPRRQVKDAARRHQHWIRLGSSSCFAALLLASSLFLIVNTIRLATFARRREIEVMKLVGASNWFVRVPFMPRAWCRASSARVRRGRGGLGPAGRC